MKSAARNILLVFALSIGLVLVVRFVTHKFSYESEIEDQFNATRKKESCSPYSVYEEVERKGNIVTVNLRPNWRCKDGRWAVKFDLSKRKIIQSSPID